MKIFFTLIFIVSIITNLQAQQFASQQSTNQSVLTYNELAEYRKTMWEEPPAALGWVNDFAGIFSNEEEFLLEKQISHFEKKTSVEISIITIDSLMVSKQNMQAFTHHLLQSWGIGKAEKSNGIVICICPDYKLVKIADGAGMERYISPSAREQILKQFMLPYFSQQLYYPGVKTTVDSIMDSVIANLYGYSKMEVHP